MCSSPRTHGHCARASRVAAIVLAALAMLAAGNRCSAQTVWTAATSDWFTPGNWTLGVPNAASGTTFDAIIDANGSVTIESTTGSNSGNPILAIDNDASVFIDGDLRLNHVGFNFPPRAAINLNGGTLRFKNYIKVVDAFGAEFNYTAGAIQLSGDRDLGTDTTVPQLFGTTPIIGAGKGLTIDFGGNITGFGAVSTPNNAATLLINNGHITGNSVAEPLTLTGVVKGVDTLDNVTITGTLAPACRRRFSSPAT
jgi:hypothetical protein